MADFIVVVGAVGLVLVFTVVTFISRFLLICQPNEVIVLSGRRRRMADGSEVGYRVIRGGRALRIVLKKPGVMEPVEASVLRGMRDLGVEGRSVRVGAKYTHPGSPWAPLV